MILTYRYEQDVNGIGPHYITSEFGQYNIGGLSAGSSSTIYYLPAADWFSGTGSVPGEHWYIYDIKSSYIYQGDGPKIYPHPQDVASGYDVTINTVVVASGGVATSTPFYQLLREGTIYKVTYEGFYNFTVVDLLASPDWYIDITYSALRSNLLGAGNLIRGAFYRITDFFTCYDRPDFYMTPPNPSFPGERNRKVTSDLVSASASVKPVVVLATSQNTISADAWQPAYPKDVIKYDITWSQTEFKGTAAKGRITERIDEYGNRTDYDHRDVEFIRYRWYEPSLQIEDIISIDFGTGQLACAGAGWSSPPTVGNVLLIEDLNNNQYWGVKLTSVGTNTANFTTDSNYSTANLTGLTARAWKTSATNHFSSFCEVYLGQKAAGDFQIFKTFQWANEGGVTQSVMNNIGNYADGFTSSTGNRFVLSNNVFGTKCYSNVLGPESANNTFGGTESSTPLLGNFFSNTAGSNFSNNIFIAPYITGGVGDQMLNNFGEYFFDNKVTISFAYNSIGNNCKNNFFSQFIINTVGDSFYINGRIDRFWRADNNQYGNAIYLCKSSNMGSNTVGSNYSEVDFADGCNNNVFGNGWQGVILRGNVIGNVMGNEIIGCTFGGAGGFQYNTLGNQYFNCEFISDPGTTTKITHNVLGSNYNSVVIRTNFLYNQLGNDNSFNSFLDSSAGGWDHSNNVIGNGMSLNLIDTPAFYGNVIGNLFINNIIVGEFSENIIGNEFKNNPVSGMPSDGLAKFNYNTIGNYFVDNVSAQGFFYNNIGHRFTLNTIGQWFQSNNTGDEFNHNTIDDYFQQNTIGSSFSSNTTGMYFRNNKIGDYFMLNTIGMYFERNDIGDFFGNNTNYGGGALDNVISDYFQDNKIGNYFGNDGSNTDGGNLILSYFRNNKIGDNFIFNLVGDSVNSNQANFTDNNIGNDFSFNIIYDGFRNNEIGNVFLGNEIGSTTSYVANFESNDIGNFFGINIISDDFLRNKIGDYFGSDGSVTAAYQTIGTNFSDNIIGNYFGNDGSNTQGENTIGVDFTQNTIDSKYFFGVISGDAFRFNHIRQGADINGVDFTATPATHVYNAYTFIIDSYKDGTGTTAWGHYYDVNGGVPNLLYDNPLL